MANFFKNPNDLNDWIRDKDTLGDAFNELMKVVKITTDIDFIEDELDIKDACTAIYNDDDEDASNVLYKILSKHNLTEALNKGVYMEKKAQSRQRNGWMRGERNKWNRAVDAYNEDTPWRVDRDQFFDFTHYAPDAISFDADPDRVYSGEAIWRMYVMDKFYREYKTEEGQWVGGYINDRFHVYPTAGTPANPDAPRDGGNQMELGLNERTRKPRPHQYSTERRLEEARGNETYDLEVTTTANSFNKLVKTASKTPVNRFDDIVYSIFTDYMDMKAAGIGYENMLDLISEHYDTSITNVAQIGKFADTMVKKHDQIAYAFDVKPVKTANSRSTYRLLSDLAAETMGDGGNVPVNLLQGTILVDDPNTPQGNYDIASGKGVGQTVIIKTDISNLTEALDALDENGEVESIQDAADEIGLNEVGEEMGVQDVQEVEEVDTFEIDEL